jgi:anthraniloyl-CoA monooxygenase
VRIVVLGGGPAGLYFALLAKKADPRRDVLVVERNPPDATYGWGVVFSEETLGALRDADRPSYDALTESFATWGTIDVRYRGEVVRCRGHAFAGVARKALLQILQRRCAELGVGLQFRRDVTDPAELPPADLVVGADGVNSLLRRAHREAFRPTLEVHPTRYVWFGTDFAFDAFTFIFRQSEHGLFQVHAYPYDARASTFIVECHESTWRRAGLDRATEEESIRFCEKLFAEDLGGHPLLSNRSLWVSFVTVRCETWHHGNVVLLGDAAHTAHFTIGSGTKLAMEDAVALAGALERHRDLETALTHYEMERQPVVERFQEAARESSAYFENVSRYASFEPVQFAFNLLTRSGRITHLELQKRDPGFVAALDAWFAERAAGGPPGTGRPASPGRVRAGRLVAPPPLLVPLHLPGRAVPNRVAVALPGEDDAEEGLPGEGHRGRATEAAASGAGLVLTELVAVSPRGRVTPGTPGLYEERHARAWRAVVEAVQEAGALAGVRLGHAGPRGSTRPRREGLDRPLRDGWPIFGPSAVPHAPWMPRPRPMTEADLEAVREEFARAAGLAAEAGFDLLELDLSHGYLLASFLSPITNRRRDGYGGPLANRLRYPLEVLDAVRATWPPDRPLAVRLTATDWAPGGLEPDDAVVIARELRDRGCHLVEPVAGQTTWTDHPDYRRLFLVPLSDRIRNEAGIPTMVGGGITTADEANTVLAAGRADLCILTLW